ncbi:hypothetical protein ACFL1G_04085 [Planctomycetota bacterium]
MATCYISDSSPEYHIRTIDVGISRKEGTLALFLCLISIDGA